MSSKKSILRTSRGIPRPVSARSNRSELSFDNSMLKPKSAGKFHAIKPTEKLLQDVDPVPVISGCDVESPKSPQGFDHMYVLQNLPFSYIESYIFVFSFAFQNSDMISSNDTKPVMFFSTPIKPPLIPFEKQDTIPSPDMIREDTVEASSLADIYELCDSPDSDEPSTIHEKTVIETISSGCETLVNPVETEIGAGDAEMKMSEDEFIVHRKWILIFASFVFLFNTFVFIYFYDRFIHLQYEVQKLRDAVMFKKEETGLVIQYNFWEHMMQYLLNFCDALVENILSFFEHWSTNPPSMTVDSKKGTTRIMFVFDYNFIVKKLFFINYLIILNNMRLINI